MVKILGLFPLTGNGGIASWTKKFLATFPDENYHITAINVSPETRKTGRRNGLFERFISGLKAKNRVIKELRMLLTKNHYDILHTTTSGNLGSYRDIAVSKLCKKHGVKTIMHCRYGCITEDIQARNLVGYLLRKSMSLFDQIWVLDTRSFNTLKNIPSLAHKVYLTPNSIEVKEVIDVNSKDYKRVAFVGNLIPTKGLFELVEASTKCDIRLDIIGPGTDEVVLKIRQVAGDKLDKSIFIHGRLPNQDAVKFMKEVDIIALPTYYPSEAFPISIIEAMSLTKMVISCPRAAVKDMLTDLDGNLCGMLVEPRSVDAIVDAINWIQCHKEEADKMCKKAYEKVYTSYRTDVVYELYRKNYNELFR